MRKEAIREILHRLDLERKKILGPRLHELGLTVGEGQGRALLCLLKEGPMTQKELADLCMRTRLPCPGIWTSLRWRAF